MCDFGTPVGSHLSNMSEMKSKGSDLYNDQQRNINFGDLTLKQQLIMLISKKKFLQPMPRSLKVKTCMNLNLGAQAPGFYLGASVPYLIRQLYECKSLFDIVPESWGKLGAWYRGG